MRVGVEKGGGQGGVEVSFGECAAAAWGRDVGVGVGVRPRNRQATPRQAPRMFKAPGCPASQRSAAQHGGSTAQRTFMVAAMISSSGRPIQASAGANTSSSMLLLGS